jgi:hypothetical protein
MWRNQTPKPPKEKSYEAFWLEKTKGSNPQYGIERVKRMIARKQKRHNRRKKIKDREREIRRECFYDDY